MRVLLRIGALLLIAAWIAVAIAVLVGTLPARGANLDGEMWRFRPGRICVEYNGTYWPTREAVRRWDAADLTAVTWNSCSSQPRNMTVKITTYRVADGACGTTGSSSSTWTYVDGRWVWVPDAVTIRLNLHQSVRAGCYATASLRAHVISHELGHAFGREHRTGHRVMAGWVATWPTAEDIADANAAY